MGRTTWRMEECVHWGHSIQFFDKYKAGQRKQKLYGHIGGGIFRPGVRVSDLATVPMETGKNLVMRVTKVEYKCDPPDMFFADALVLGYEGEVNPDMRVGRWVQVKDWWERRKGGRE